MLARCISAIVDRAYKNELTAQLFPYRVREKLSTIVRNCSRSSINHLFPIEINEDHKPPSRGTAFERAEQLRTRFYELYEICCKPYIVNILAELIGDRCLVYMHDILIIGENLKEHNSK